MNVEVKSSSGISLVPLDSRLMAERKIFIEGEIDSDKALEFTKKMLLLNRQDTHKPIDIIIHSDGGEVNAGMLIYDVLKGSPAPIKTFCVGKAYSMAAVLFACGNHGRFMLPHSELMLHEPLIDNRVGGSSSSIKSISDTLIATKQKLNEIISHCTGKTAKEVEKATSFDHFFNPKEAVDFGLADEIITFNELLEVESL